MRSNPPPERAAEYLKQAGEAFGAGGMATSQNPFAHTGALFTADALLCQKN